MESERRTQAENAGMPPVIYRPLMRVFLVAVILWGAGSQGDRAGAGQPRGGSEVQRFGEIAKVKVDSAGVIYLNGTLVTIEALKQEFARLKQVNGAVWYYRENPQGQPTPQAMAVIQAIIDAKLPVKVLERDFN
jgi:hypothetical protein